MNEIVLIIVKKECRQLKSKNEKNFLPQLVKN